MFVISIIAAHAHVDLTVGIRGLNEGDKTLFAPVECKLERCSDNVCCSA